MSSENVKQFYNGKTILITGATGYIGRLMIAKLMRLGNLKQIVLLSRPKKGKSNGERLDKILSGFLFEEMDKFDPSFRSKLKVVNGDMEIENLGMSSEDREYIKQHVEIIIHGAATVRFDEEIKKAIRINIQGTKNMLDLGAECESLLSFVHISTAYSQCPRSEINEVFYEPPMDYRQALQLLNVVETDIESLTPILIRPWPNTYTFTKAVSEDMIRQYQDKLPVAIIRPSIVATTIIDPVSGFADSILGILGVGLGCVVGLIRIFKADPKTALDLVPSDFVINYTLVIAWIAAQSKIEVNSKIFLCCFGNVRNESIADMIKVFMRMSKTYPYKQMVWYPTISMTPSGFRFKIYSLLYHYIPAIFIDIVLRYKESKYRLVSIYAKISSQIELLSYFSERMWKFNDDNKFKVYEMMSASDHKEFQLQAEEKLIKEWNEQTMIGFSKYFFNQTEEDLVEGRRKIKILFVLHYSFLAVIYFGLFYFLYRTFGNECLKMLPVIYGF